MSEPVRLNGKSADTKEGAKDGGWAETPKLLFQVLVIALVVRAFLFQPFNIPSGSMIPTLLIGDYLFVSKFSYGYSRYSFPCVPNLVDAAKQIFVDPRMEVKSYCLPASVLSGRIFAAQPKRGDVVVFKLPRDGQTDFIKRVIGLPGDRIQMKEGRLYINDELIPRQPIAKVTTQDFYGRETEVPTYEETLPGGVKHTIIEIQGDSGYKDNTQVFEVPPGHYFMMGDNRDNSTDSRYSQEENGVGYVPFDNLVGRAEFIFFSLDSKGESLWRIWNWPSWTVRWGRLLTPVK